VFPKEQLEEFYYSRKSMSARNVIQSSSKTNKPPEHVTDIHVIDKCVIRRTIHELCVQEKASATISTLFPKLRDRINFKGGSTSLRNIVKELAFLWKTRNNRVAAVVSFATH
jgi:hypothetical protein